MNPFEVTAKPIEESLGNWCSLYPKPYNKNEVDPYTKTRIILMNGTEFEANWFSHQFARHITDGDLKRELSLSRMVEKQQQLKISLLKPCDETPLEHTIGYEQLAVDLTAELARRESDCYVKRALDFALLEDFDHLYRYADLLSMTECKRAERLVGGYTEIMPGRPTISHHRFPIDNVKRPINIKTADTETILATMIITAAEQQTMNYYMNITNFSGADLSRRLYEEIALVEEEHVTQYESLMDPTTTWLECLLLHEYCECYLYWSCYMTESDPYIKALWEEYFHYEVSHLKNAARLLEKYEKKTVAEVIPNPEFPAPLSLHENIEYVRSVLANTVQFTGNREEYTKLENLPSDFDFFTYQKRVNPTTNIVPSHIVIETHIKNCGRDYRYETAPNPIKELRSGVSDNTSVGRKPGAAESTDFFCNPPKN